MGLIHLQEFGIETGLLEQVLLHFIDLIHQLLGELGNINRALGGEAFSQLRVAVEEQQGGRDQQGDKRRDPNGDVQARSPVFLFFAVRFHGPAHLHSSIKSPFEPLTPLFFAAACIA
ncbi:hypothetical protein SDC9_208519 [bioreactor metagenome]|uniref:Uncharacterized protein n=1 Tax=bioreactor metagenome TaxID=1076179 RepID=A0A645JBS8_9ZZZZ